MFSTTFFRTKTEPQENYNLQTIFSKIIAVPQAQPLKECRLFLETMRQECKFQKGMINRTKDVLVPRFKTLENERCQTFRNYQKLLKYSQKKDASLNFQRLAIDKIKKKVKKNKVLSLRQFIDDKKAKMLVQNSKQYLQDIEIQNILRNDRLRQNVFDQSILIQRMNEIKRKLNIQQQTMTIPSQFKGLNPKHLKNLQEEHQEKHYTRRKYVSNRTKFQFFKNAIKAQQNLLKTKQKQSKLVISSLMKHYSDQVLNNDEIKLKINRCIHRLFLKYANNDTENMATMYKIIRKDHLIRFFEDFQLRYQQNQKIQNIMKQQINQFKFLEILHELSLKKGEKFQGDINQFLQKNILNHPQKYLPLEWTIYEKNLAFINKYLKFKRFKEKIQLIYTNFIKKKRTKTHYYNFDDMVEVMWMLKIYPFMISKKKLRFFYLYTENEESGVSIKDIMDIYMYIAIARQGSLQQNIEEIVKNVLQFSKTQKPI